MIDPGKAPAAENSGFKLKLVLLLSSTMTIMSGATISPSLPGMRSVFADTRLVDVLVPLVLTAPALSIAITSFFVGYLADRFGRKPVLGFALLLYGVSGTSGLYLSSLGSIIAGRVVLGVAVAGIMTCTNALIADYYSGIARAKFMGVQNSFVALGGVLFLVMGGVLADAHWRAPFVIYSLSLLLLPAALYILHEPVHKGPAVPGSSAPLRVAPWGLLSVIYLMAFSAQIIFYAIPVKLPFLVEEIAGPSATLAGVAIATSTFCAAISSLFHSRVRQFLSYQGVYAMQALLFCAGYLMLAYSDSYAEVMAAMAVCGTGFGQFMPNTAIWLAELAPEEMRGRLFGLLTMSLFLGQFVSPFFTQPVNSLNGLRGPFGVYGSGAIMGGVVAMIFLVWAIKIHRSKKSN